jgi:hypothetical protein
VSKFQKRCSPTPFFARLLALWWRLLYRSRAPSSLQTLGDGRSNHETKTTLPLTLWISLDRSLEAAEGNHVFTADFVVSNTEHTSTVRSQHSAAAR